MNSTLQQALAAARSAELQRAALDARLEARGKDGGSRLPRRPFRRQRNGSGKRRAWTLPRLRAA
jgi:hypothetical protein